MWALMDPSGLLVLNEHYFLAVLYFGIEPCCWRVKLESLLIMHITS
jgi:hypothetical protein